MRDMKINSVRQMATKLTKTRKRLVSSEEAVIPPKRAKKRQKHTPRLSKGKLYDRKVGWRAAEDTTVHRVFDNNEERIKKEKK